MAKKLTKEEVVERIKKVHGDKYDFSEFLKEEFEYKNKSQKIPLICHEKYPNEKEHGIFWKDLTHLEYRKQGYPRCGSIKRYDIDIFKELATEKYNGLYDYSDTHYLSSESNDILVRCKIHGEFPTTPGRHLNGSGCPYCTKSRIDTEEKIKKFNEIHNYKYDYSKTIILSATYDIEIICPKHGVFNLTPNEHENGLGCPMCAEENKKEHPNKKTFEEVVEEIKQIHGNDIIVPFQEYKNKYTKMKLICPKHGEFESNLTHLKEGKGCPICNASHLEKEIRTFLINMEIDFIHNCTNKNLVWLGLLRLDFYLPQYNVAIECQGEQHFIEKEFFNKKEAFEHRLELDTLKKKLCEENGVKLLYYSNLGIEYPYEVFEDKEKLLNEIKKY